MLQLTPTALAWLEGIKAFQAGQSRSANPYAEIANASAAPLRREWFCGWDVSAIIIAPKHFGRESVNV